MRRPRTSAAPALVRHPHRAPAVGRGRDCSSAFQSALGLSITARCPLACSHCIVDAGRHRTEEMPLEVARACLDSCTAHRPPIRTIIITGGEPFYAPALLKAVLSHASSLGLLSVVITNAFWANTESAALATLSGFGEIGMLTASTDKYHRAFISPRKFSNAAKAASQLSIPFTAAACADTEDERAQIAADLGGIVSPDRIRIVHTLPAGRAARAPATVGEPDRVETAGPCTGADFPIVFPDGRVIACMGIVGGLHRPHPLLLGNVNERPLAALLAPAEHDVFLHAVRALGPDAIVRLLHRETGARPVMNAAYGRCALCYAMAADRGLLDRVLRLLSNKGVVERVADARRRYLDERWAPATRRARRDRMSERRP